MQGTPNLTKLAAKLKALKKAQARLFASQVELRIQMSLAADEQEELHFKNQYLQALSTFLCASAPDSRESKDSPTTHSPNPDHLLPY